MNKLFTTAPTMEMDYKSLQNGCQDAEIEIKVTTLKNEKFSFTWIVSDFGAIMDRKYEFSSPVFSMTSSSGIMKWKMLLRPENMYPEGTNVLLRLQKLSEDDAIYSVLYTISVKDGHGKYHVVNTREKLFRHYLDSDECLIGSNRHFKEKKLLENNNLTICCQLDVLVSENVDDTISLCELSDGEFAKCAVSNGDNIPSNMQYVNDLSSSLKCKNSDSLCDENLDFQIEKGNCFNETKLNNSLSFENGCSKEKDKSFEILLEDLEDLFSDKHEHDVTIHTKDGKMTAHSVILKARSKYFKRLLMNDKNEVHIPTIDTFALGVVMYYLYTGKLQNFPVQTAIDVLGACQIMNLPYLSEMVQGSIKSQITINNVLQVFTLAKDIKLDSLKKCALKFIADNHDELSATQQWKRITKNDPHAAAEILLTVASFQNKLRNEF